MHAEKIRNICEELKRRGRDGTVRPEHFAIAFDNLAEIADAVERLEAMEIPETQRVQVADLEDGTVVLFDEYRLIRGGLRILPGGAA